MLQPIDEAISKRWAVGEKVKMWLLSTYGMK